MSAPLTTGAFLSTLGVNIHIEYTDGTYANAANVITGLAYLGVTRVRDAVLDPGNQGQQSYDVLAQAGVKFDLFFQGNDLPSTLSLVRAFDQRHPGAVSLIEGPNEVNNFPISYAGLSGTAAATAYQAALYDVVKADSVLNDVPVADLTSWPFLSGPSDDANYHFYPFNGQQPSVAYGSTFFAALSAVEPGKPVVMTEGGYNTLLTDRYFGGVDETTQAKLILNMYCDNARAGVTLTYVYQLLDAYADPTGSNSDSHFGLFHLDGTPKVAATALHDLTTQLSLGSDDSASPAPLGFEISGVPATGGLLDLAKNATTHDLVIWSEPIIWDAATQTGVAAAASATTLHFDVAQTVDVFDPLVGGAPVSHYDNVTELSLTVVDHPLIIEVSPSTLQVSATSAMTSVVGDGAGNLFLFSDGREIAVPQVQSISFSDLSVSTAQALGVVSAYENLLGRAPTGAELAVWSSALQAGAAGAVSMSAVIAGADASVGGGLKRLSSTSATITSLGGHPLQPRSGFGRAPCAVGTPHRRSSARFLRASPIRRENWRQ